MLKFLFHGHDLKFLTPIIDRMKSKEGVEVKVQLHKGHQLTEAEQADAFKLNEWADIVFCEWALGNAVWFSKHKRPGQLLVVRMHFQEYHEKHLPFLSSMDWENVDSLIVICPDAYDFVKSEYPQWLHKVHYIPNPLEIARRFSCNRLPGAEMSLGLLGIVPWRKRPDLGVQIQKGAQHKGLDMDLHIKGKTPHDYPWMKGPRFEDDLKKYSNFFDQIKDDKSEGTVVFDGFDPEPGRWYSERGFILSTSDFEGSHQAVAEGMAQGCIPVIRNWQGAAALYPKEFVWNDVEEATTLISACLQSPREYWKQVEKCREFAKDHFDADDIFLKYEELFAKHSLYVTCAESSPYADLRIAILAYIPPHANNGYRVRVEQFIKQYTRLGLRVLLICLHNGRSSKRELTSHREELRKLGCEVELVSVPFFFEMTFTSEQESAIKASLKPLIEKYRIQWLQAEAGFCARVAVISKEACDGLKVSFDCHGVLPEEAAMGGSSQPRVLAIEKMECQILHKSDFVIYVSHAMHAHYIAKYGVLKNSLIVPCCIRENSIRSSIVTRDVKCGLPADGRPILGYLGSMAVWQCSEEMGTLFGAVHRKHPDVFFAVFTPNADQQKAQSLFDKNKIAKTAYTITELAFEEVPYVLTRLNAGMMLRLDSAVNRVASPTKFGEMIAAGVPVVATDCIGDYSDDVVNNDLGLIIPHSEVVNQTFSDTTIEEIYKLLIEKRNLNDGFVSTSTKYSRENLFWNVYAERLIRVYWRFSL